MPYWQGVLGSRGTDHYVTKFLAHCIWMLGSPLSAQFKKEKEKLKDVQSRVKSVVMRAHHSIWQIKGYKNFEK